MKPRGEIARWAAWCAGVRKFAPLEVLFVEDVDGQESTTPGTIDDLVEGAPPAPGVTVYAKPEHRDEPFVFYPSPGASAGRAALGSPELKAIIAAVKEGHGRYSELVGPTLVMYRDENTRYIERIRELEGRIRDLEQIIATANAKTVDERMEERRQADTRHVIEKILLPRLDKVMQLVEGKTAMATIATDLGVLMEGIPEEVREKIVAVDPARAHRLLSALESMGES